MGIDFSHSDAHWAYSGFHRFRTAIAAHEGIELGAMRGFTSTGGSRPWHDVSTPLRPLLDHSDCDGELTPKECAQIAPRLREVVAAVWPDPDSYDHQHGMLLADGMDLAAKQGEPLIFC